MIYEISTVMISDPVEKRMISDHVTISDHVEKEMTISEHVEKEMTISEHVEKEMTISVSNSYTRHHHRSSCDGPTVDTCPTSTPESRHGDHRDGREEMLGYPHRCPW
jgi:thiaminase